MKNIGLIFFLLLSSISFGQFNQQLIDGENELQTLLNSLRAAENNSEKRERNVAFSAKLKEVLQIEGALLYPFSKLRTVGFIDSPDKEVRIINWNVEQDDQTQKYNCFILQKDDKKEITHLHELTKGNDVMALRPTDVLQSNQWYGALYYQMIPFDKSNKQMYVLLGWDGLGPTSNMKLLDVLYFSGNQAKLGSPVFKVGNETLKRVFYEHSEKATMSLRYDPKYDRIIFDHLSPETPNLKGHYTFYVPDLSYDAFVLKSGKWYLKEDVIAINAEQKDNKMEIYVMDKSGKVIKDSTDTPLKKVKYKNRWIDPSNSDAPAGGNSHEAAMPELEDQGEDTKETKEKKERKKLFQKKDKRDPNNQYPYSDVNQLKKKRKRN